MSVEAMINFVSEFVENCELYQLLWRSYMNNLLENCGEISKQVVSFSEV